MFQVMLGNPAAEQMRFAHIAGTMAENPEFCAYVEQTMGELIGISWDREDTMDENRKCFLPDCVARKARIRAIGQELNEKGSFGLMQFVAETIRGFCRHPVDVRTLEFAWDGIGEGSC